MSSARNVFEETAKLPATQLSHEMMKPAVEKVLGILQRTGNTDLAEMMGIDPVSREKNNY